MRASLRWQAPTASSDDEEHLSIRDPPIQQRSVAFQSSTASQPTPRRKLTRKKFVAPTSPPQQKPPGTQQFQFQSAYSPFSPPSPTVSTTLSQSPSLPPKPTASPVITPQTPAIQRSRPQNDSKSSAPQINTPNASPHDQPQQRTLYHISPQVHSTDDRFSPFNSNPPLRPPQIVTPSTYIGPSFRAPRLSPLPQPSTKQEKQFIENLVNLFNPNLTSAQNLPKSTPLTSPCVQNTPLALHDDVQLHVNQLLLEAHLNTTYPSTHHPSTHTNTYTNFIVPTDPLRPLPDSPYDRKDTIGQSILCYLFHQKQLENIHQPMTTRYDVVEQQSQSGYNAIPTRYNLPNTAYQYLSGLKRSILNNENWFTSSSNFFHQYIRKQFNEYTNNTRITKTSQKTITNNVNDFVKNFYNPTEQLTGYATFLQLLHQYCNYFTTFQSKPEFPTNGKYGLFSATEITHFKDELHSVTSTCIENSILYPLHNIIQQTIQPLQGISEIVQMPITIVQKQKVYGTHLQQSVLEPVFEHLLLLLILGRYEDIITICTHEVFKNTPHQTVLVFLLDLFALIYSKRKDEYFLVSTPATMGLERYRQRSPIAKAGDDDEDDGYGLPQDPNDRFVYLVHLWRSQQWSNHLNYKLSPALVTFFKLIVGIVDNDVTTDVINRLYFHTTLGHTLYQAYYIAEEYLTANQAPPPSKPPTTSTQPSTTTNQPPHSFFQLVEDAFKSRFVANWSWLISILISLYHIRIPSELNILDTNATDIDGIAVNVRSKQLSIFNFDTSSNSSTPPSTATLLGMYFTAHIEDKRKPILLPDFLSVVSSVNSDYVSAFTVGNQDSLIASNGSNTSQQYWGQNINITLVDFFAALPHPIVYDTLFGNVARNNQTDFSKYRELYAGDLWDKLNQFTDTNQALFPHTSSSQTSLLLTSLPSSITQPMIASRESNTNVIVNLQWFTGTTLLTLLYQHSNFNTLYYPLTEAPVFTLQSLIYQFKDILLAFKQWQWACYVLQHTVYYNDSRTTFGNQGQLKPSDPTQDNGSLIAHLLQDSTCPTSHPVLTSFTTAITSYQHSTDKRTSNGLKLNNEHIYDIWSILLDHISPIPQDHFILLDDTAKAEGNDQSAGNGYKIDFPVPPCPQGMELNMFNALVHYVTILRNLGVTSNSMVQYYSELKHLEVFGNDQPLPAESDPLFAASSLLAAESNDNLDDITQHGAHQGSKKRHKRPSVRFSLGGDETSDSDDAQISDNGNVVKKAKCAQNEHGTESVVLGLGSFDQPGVKESEDTFGLVEMNHKLNIFAKTAINGVQIGLDEIQEITNFLSVLFILEQEHLKCQSKGLGRPTSPLLPLFVDSSNTSATSTSTSPQLSTNPNVAIQTHLSNIFKPSPEQDLINNLYTPQSIDNFRLVLIQFFAYYENWEAQQALLTKPALRTSSPSSLVSKQRKSIQHVQGMVDDFDQVGQTIPQSHNPVLCPISDFTEGFSALLERNNSYTDQWLIQFVQLPDVLITLARYLVATRPQPTQSQSKQLSLFPSSPAQSPTSHTIFQFLLMLRLEQQWVQHKYTFSSSPSIYQHYYSHYQLPYLARYMTSIYTSHYYNPQQYNTYQLHQSPRPIHPGRTNEFQYYSSFFSHLPTQIEIPLSGPITSPMMLSLLEDVTQFRPTVSFDTKSSTSSTSSNKPLTSAFWKQILGEKESQSTPTISLPFFTFFTHKYPIHTTFISTFSTHLCPMIFNLSHKYQQQCEEHILNTAQSADDIHYPLHLRPQYFQQQFVHLYCLYFLPQINHWATVSQIVDQELFLTGVHEMINPLYEAQLLTPSTSPNTPFSISQAMKAMSKQLISLATKESIQMMFTFSCYYVLGLLYRYMSLTEAVETFIGDHIDENGQFIDEVLSTQNSESQVHPIGIVCDSIDVLLGDMYFLLSVGDSRYTALLVPYTKRLIETKLCLFKVLISSTQEEDDEDM